MGHSLYPSLSGALMSSPLRVKALIGLPLIAVILAFYFFFNPESTWWMPKCPTYVLTGLQCPGCGSQRAIFALLHGHFAEAFHYNAFMVVMAPLLIFIGIVELNRRRWRRLSAVVFHPAVLIIIMGAVIFWTIWRNVTPLLFP